ncbi:MAG TPA: HDOD domain-containing protein [Thiomicrospira sp.]|nr:HDOD domain-containing protein [Thiomicrospira sp.]
MKNRLAIAAKILYKVSLPNISNEVSRLQEESLKKDPDILVVTQCISRNPKLLTKFLAVATLVSKKEVTTGRQAVEILGTDGIFSVFFSSAIEFCFQSEDESGAIVNQAIKIATAMSDLAMSIDGVKSSDAYLYGLMYNVGYIVLSRYDSKLYKSCFTTSLMRPSESTKKELKLFGTTSNCIGVYVAKKWRVKNSIYSGILFQDSESNQKCEKGENLAYELTHLLNIARLAVAEVDNGSYITEEIRNKARGSMACLGVKNLQYIRALKKIKRHTHDLDPLPEDYFENQVDEIA